VAEADGGRRGRVAGAHHLLVHGHDDRFDDDDLKSLSNVLAKCFRQKNGEHIFRPFRLRKQLLTQKRQSVYWLLR
jgi:hypothetical protein